MTLELPDGKCYLTNYIPYNAKYRNRISNYVGIVIGNYLYPIVYSEYQKIRNGKQTNFKLISDPSTNQDYYSFETIQTSLNLIDQSLMLTEYRQFWYVDYHPQYNVLIIWATDNQNGDIKSIISNNQFVVESEDEDEKEDEPQQPQENVIPSLEKDEEEDVEVDEPQQPQENVIPSLEKDENVDVEVDEPQQPQENVIPSPPQPQQENVIPPLEEDDDEPESQENVIPSPPQQSELQQEDDDEPEPQQQENVRVNNICIECGNQGTGEYDEFGMWICQNCQSINFYVFM